MKYILLFLVFICSFTIQTVADQYIENNNKSYEDTRPINNFIVIPKKPYILITPKGKWVFVPGVGWIAIYDKEITTASWG